MTVAISEKMDRYNGSGYESKKVAFDIFSWGW